MNKSLIYLYKQSLINRLRYASKKPVFYVYTIGVLLYVGFMIGILMDALIKNKLNTPSIMALFLSATVLFLGPSNFISYAKRKGLLFTPSDVHFVFTAPITPKRVLMYAHAKSILVSLGMTLLEIVLGIFVFHVPFLAILGCVLITCIFDMMLQASMVVLLYGNERFSETTIKWIARGLWLLILGLVAVVGVVIYTDGFSLSNMFTLFSNPMIQGIPILGWQVAAIQMFLVGPTTVNVICTVFFVIATAVFVWFAVKMKCKGEFYEEAMKFADDYQEARNRSKKGEAALIGRKQSFKSASITYKGGGAKSIFYRQLLEYKKSKFYIFGMTSIFYLGAGILFSYLAIKGEFNNTGIGKNFIIPGVIMYITLVFSGMQTKWEKELENPYTFLIPDKSIYKLWYATLMEHVRSLCHGLMIAIPTVFAFELPIWYIPLYTVFTICIHAIKLYSDTVCEAFLGNMIGKTPKILLRMILMWTAVGVVVPIVFVGVLVASVEVGLLLGCLYLVILGGGLMFLSATIFSKMEMQGIPS